MSRHEKVTYANVLYALKSFDGWTTDDRTGWALRRDGFPDKETFLLDVELWPIEDNPAEQQKLIETFDQWLQNESIHSVDSVKQRNIIIYRVRCFRQQAEMLLHHRDARTIDLTPRYSTDLQIFKTDINAIPPLAHPPEDALRIGILDCGIVTNRKLF